MEPSLYTGEDPHRILRKGNVVAFICYLKKENIHIHSAIQSKDELLQRLAVLAADSGLGVSQQSLFSKLQEREQTMSTGIGNAVGVPHTLVESVQGLHVFVITLRDPIPFDAVDRKPVCVVIGMLGNPEQPNESLGALATLGRILRDESFVGSLWKACSPEEVYRLFEEKETKKG